MIPARGGKGVSLREQVYSVLIVSASEALNGALIPLLPESKFDPIHIEYSVNAAERSLSERAFDLIIINSPLPDDTGIRFAVDSSGLKQSVALLLVRSDVYEETYEKAAGSGVMLLARPLSRTAFQQAVDWMISVRERLKLFDRKSTNLEDKMQEIRTVNRAKWVLIEKRGYSEADAHRYIEKTAMDRCVSKKTIAEEIIAGG